MNERIHGLIYLDHLSGSGGEVIGCIDPLRGVLLINIVDMHQSNFLRTNYILEMDVRINFIPLY